MVTHREGPASTLTFWGAVGTVTGSSFLLERDGHRLLVDCGLYQGERVWRRRNWAPQPYLPSDIDDIVLTHAHLDHCGRIPALTREGYAGRVWCTEGTRRLAALVLRDSAHLQEEYAEAARAGGFSRHDPPHPPYTGADAESAIRALRPIAYNTPQVLPSGAVLTLGRAGHILGSATAHVRLDRASVLFSGDLGRTSHPLLRPREDPPAARTVVVEATYGDRAHPDPGDAHGAFAEAINGALGRGGSVLVPAFAIDRTEVVLRALSDMTRAGSIPDVPVHVDSPMAIAAWDVYRSADLRGELRADLPARVVDNLDLHLAHSAEESIELNHPRRPSIVVSASGMLAGGRIVHHLQSMLPDSRNTVVLTGFQASGTPGRLLADGATELRLYGRYVPVRAQVVTDEGFSVHADSDELLAWLERLPHAPETVYVVHGEDQARRRLAEKVRAATGWCVAVPGLGESVRVD